MALFTDGPASTMDDLAAQDSQILDTASIEGIDLGRKLATAQDELSLEITSLLNRRSPSLDPLWLTAAPDVSHVVVTPPLKLWHTFRSLELTYQEAYFNQLNERYSGKRDAFHEMAVWAREKLIDLGLGIATDPAPRAATPTVQTTVGNLAAGTYYVTMAWVNRTGQEGASAIPAVASTANDTLLVQPVNAPGNATGWNVYLGQTPESMTLQNGTPIAPTLSWTQPNVATTNGRTAGCGQAPSYMFVTARTLERG